MKSLRVIGTPRRLVTLVEGLSSHQSSQKQVVKGPPADRAFNPDGTPTKAAEGFARSKGVSLSDLELREIDGGRYVTVNVNQEGRTTPQVLSEVLPGLITSLRFDRPMRWNSSNISFSRPIRWLLALYGEGENSQVISFEYAGLSSHKMTRGLRFSQPQEKQINSTREYFDYLRSQGILLDPAERKASISEQIHHLANEAGGQIAEDPNLLNEVANLVEAPTAVLGSFDPASLELPPRSVDLGDEKTSALFPGIFEQVGIERKTKSAASFHCSAQW